MKIQEILNEDHGYGYYVKKGNKKKWVKDKTAANKESKKMKKDCANSVKIEADKD